jgi:hypothetical protein
MHLEPAGVWPDRVLRGAVRPQEARLLGTGLRHGQQRHGRAAVV